MRVLCAIGQRGGPELIERLVAVVGNKVECLLLHVIDAGPRHELEKHLRGPLRHRPPHEPDRETTLQAAEESAGQAALQEALAAAHQAGLTAGTTLRRGKAEKIIVEVAQDMAVSLVIISAREGAAGHPRLGPASVGHTARFVLDHAPCDVLLLRELR